MSRPIRWGILGTGNMARQFARGLRLAENAELVAVGSRSRETANLFGRQFGVPHCHEGYADLAGDPDVDVVYIATPNSLHMENSLLCLDSGKAVLCEKPFAINADQGQRVVAFARERKRFVMEALWTRFLPPVARLRQLLAEGVIGEVRMVSADFGIRAERDPARRLFDPALGGGCLLDLGVYTISLATMILGEPTDVTGLADIGPTGVDEQATFSLLYGGGRLATLLAAIRTETAQEAQVCGTSGRIRLHAPWWKGGPVTVTAGPGGKTWTEHPPVEGNGYHYEADEVGRRLRQGRLESEIMPLDETLTVLRTMDRLRWLWGLAYPMESRQAEVRGRQFAGRGR